MRAKIEGEEPPTIKALNSATRVVDMIAAHCPLGLSDVTIEDGGIVADVRNDRENFITVHCENGGDITVLFNVLSYATFENIEKAESNGFLASLLETMRY